MSNRSIMRRSRNKVSKRTPAGQTPVCVIPGAKVPTGPAPLCRSHREPMVFTACACHPSHGDWQCARDPLIGHMKRVR